MATILTYPNPSDGRDYVIRIDNNENDTGKICSVFLLTEEGTTMKPSEKFLQKFESALDVPIAQLLLRGKGIVNTYRGKLLMQQ